MEPLKDTETSQWPNSNKILQNWERPFQANICEMEASVELKPSHLAVFKVRIKYILNPFISTLVI